MVHYPVINNHSLCGITAYALERSYILSRWNLALRSLQVIKLKRRTFIFLCLVSLIHEFGGNEEFKFGNIINTINVGLFLFFFFPFLFSLMILDL